MIRTITFCCPAGWIFLCCVLLKDVLVWSKTEVERCLCLITYETGKKIITNEHCPQAA